MFDLRRALIRAPTRATAAEPQANRFELEARRDLRDEMTHAASSARAQPGRARGGRCLPYFANVTVRPPSGCTGRLVSPCVASWNFLICPSDTSTGVASTNQLTPSLQGGVVSEPV